MPASLIRTVLALASVAAAVAVPQPSTTTSACPVTTTLGTINVITNDTVVHGCLTDVGLFHATSSTSGDDDCAVFTVVEYSNPPSTWYPGCYGGNYNFSTSAGPCGSPYLTGDQYEQGGDSIFQCGGDLGNTPPYYQFTSGVNDLDNMNNLVMYGAADIDEWNTIEGKVPSNGKNVVLQIREPDAPTGPDYYLAFEQQS